MSLQLSVTVRNARLDTIESTIGVSPILRVYTGSQPADCATSASGTLLAHINLPSDWLADASAGSKSLSGTWQTTSADGTGTAGYFRLYDSTGTTCHVQGSITATGGGGDMTVDNTSFAAGQTFTVVTFQLTEANG